MSNQHYDVLIIGAGVSGIGLACHLARSCPEKSVAILERRSDLGGTWDLFRYPGIRSDSDMYTFGYSFRPWTRTRILADGPAIKGYVRETAREYNIEDKIHFGLAVRRVKWSSENARWTVYARDESTGGNRRFSCNFVIGATGYYQYDQGYKPDFPGEEQFAGQIVHPQHWPEDLDYKGKKVVIIGSGATAITLVPAMAGEAEHVTMLQRSPGYIASLPAIDRISEQLYRVLPDEWVYRLARKRNITLQNLIYKVSQRWPGPTRWVLRKAVEKQVGRNVDMEHFDPGYNPWDERLCVVPNGDLFRTLKNGDASIVTDHIETFTENGIRLQSGEELEADIIMTATGLNLQLLGDTEVEVDGESVDPSDRAMYKGVMLEGVPNAAMIFGYINASWTLKVDIAGEYLGRLLRHMDTCDHIIAVPRDHEGCKTEHSMLDALKSGYARRAAPLLPRQGTKAPWKITHDYQADRKVLREDPIDDGILEFETAAGRRSDAA